MRLLLHLTVAAVATSVALPQHAASDDDYVARFERALTAFDRGAYEDAAHAFELAGKLAWSAPVWRVHRAVALARAGDLAGAREEAIEALRRGYPPSDLAAIDDRLLPAEAVATEWAPREAAAVLRLGPEAVGGRGPLVLEGDLAVLESTAYELVKGRLFATRRPTQPRVIGHATRADGMHEDLVHSERPGPWDHVDGRVAAVPSTGRSEAAVSIPSEVHALDDVQQRRGLRTGFWDDGVEPDDTARFVDGALRIGGDLSIDVDFLRAEIGEWSADASLPDSFVVDPAVRARVAELLGEPLALQDQVHRFAGLEPWIVLRDSGSRDAALGRAAFLAVDPKRGVIGTPDIDSDLMCGVQLGAAVHVPAARLIVTSNAAGETLEAISTESWSVVWNVPWRTDGLVTVPQCHAGRSLRVRGSRVLSEARWPLRVEAHDVVTGELVFDGADLDLTAIDGSDDERWIVARSGDATYLLDGGSFEPIVELSVERSDQGPPRLSAFGVDGTFQAPAARIREAQVLLPGRFVPATDVAPWLWDPLHVRSLRNDADRSPRHVDTKKIARATEVTFGTPDAVVLAEDAPVVVALGRRGALRVHAAEDGEQLAEANGSRARGWALDVSPDGELVALLTRDNQIYLWRWRDRALPERVGQLEGRAAWANTGFGGHVSFSPKGDRVLVAHDGSDRVLLDRKGKVVARIPRQDESIEIADDDGARPILAWGCDESVSWSPAGESIALVTGGRPALHDASTGAPLDVDLETYGESVLVLALDPEGRRLAAGTFRGHVVCWDLESGDLLWDHQHQDPFLGPHDDNGYWIALGDVSFSPDGRWLAATTTPGIHALLLDAETGQRAWIGPHRGGRMGEPALITWSQDSSCFYYSYISWSGRVRRVALGADVSESTPPLQVDLMAGSPLDVGWNGLTVGATKRGVLVRSGSTGELRWAR